MTLLDTTFLIHYWGGDEDAGRYLAAHDDTDEFVTTTINLKELAVGRHRQGVFDAREIESTFGWLDVVPFESEHAYEAATLEADLWADDRSDDGSRPSPPPYSSREPLAHSTHRS